MAAGSDVNECRRTSPRKPCAARIAPRQTRFSLSRSGSGPAREARRGEGRVFWGRLLIKTDPHRPRSLRSLGHPLPERERVIRPPVQCLLPVSEPPLPPPPRFWRLPPAPCVLCAGPLFPDCCASAVS